MSVESHDKKLSTLLEWVENGTAQLPEFQRSWVWDDTKICKLIESITSGYPMGAAMFLANGGDSIRFKYRTFSGVPEKVNVVPDWLVLDGQQRLTTLFQVFKSTAPVETCLETNKDKRILRYYYLNIKKCLDPKEDRLEAIVSISEKKLITSDIGRKIELDLTTPEQEYKNFMFPLNLVFSENDMDDWRFRFENYHGATEEIRFLFRDFKQKIINTITGYNIPVIELTKDTSKEAVCQIFENVNTGGVPLTVFELVTATFAAEEFNLREDWDKITAGFAKRPNGDILKDISGANYLASMSLLVSYKKSLKNEGAVSCKKRDILRLNLVDYKANREALIDGFHKAVDFLVYQGVYSSDDLPYSSQIIPLAAMFAYDGENKKHFDIIQNRDKLSKWYWCGVFGELYGGANEARFALDIANIFTWIEGGDVPNTIERANFQPTRLLSMQTRNSAAYKGVMAVIMQDSPLDFMTGRKMDVANYLKEKTDIHHIFPQEYCKRMNYPERKWNSVVNKTPIYFSTNRSIGGSAPSLYVESMKKKGIDEPTIVKAIASHKIAPDLLLADKFDEYFVDRAIKILDRIELATGKAITGRESEDTIKAFGSSLVGKDKELIRHCLFYKGGETCPDEVSSLIGGRQIWFYEKRWVEMSLAGELFEQELGEYDAFGMSDFSVDDGVPITLKALLFNRYYAGGPMENGGSAFREWYNNNYLSNKPE